MKNILTVSREYGSGGYDVVFPRLNGEEEADK